MAKINKEEPEGEGFSDQDNMSLNSGNNSSENEVQTAKQMKKLSMMTKAKLAR